MLGAGGVGDVQACVRRAQTGDRAAFATLYLLFFRRVYRYLVVRLGNVDDAQEVAQDVFERLLTRLRDYDPSCGPFRPWLFSIAHNLAVDHLRRRARSEVAPADDEIALSERGAGAVGRFESDHAFQSMIAVLPQQQRRVLLLRFVYELPTDAIAELVGCSCAAVRQAQHRALDSLGSTLELREAAA